MDLRGAKLTLANGTFRHAKPSDFNDTEDLTIQSVLPGNLDDALAELENSFVDVIIKHLDEPPTCDSPMREKLTLLQQALKLNREAEKVLREGLAETPVYDRDFMRIRTEGHIQEINDFMQGYRIFCVTTHNRSERMWTEYADNHRGIMIRIVPCHSRDSKFNLFCPVQYQDVRPPLYNNAVDFIAGSLFGDRPAIISAIIEKIIYTKTRQWEHEAEYRLAIPLAQGEKPWEFLSYHPEEITELYLGTAMDEEDKGEIVGLAKARNPKIIAYGSNCDGHDNISYYPFES